MSPLKRVLLCGVLLASGWGAEAALESYARIERPNLRRPLSTIPTMLGDWEGTNEQVDPLILAKSQCTEYINRIYVNRKNPNQKLWLWMNFSLYGLNLRHSPEVCLPSGGWNKIESLCREVPVEFERGKTNMMTRLGYSQGENVQEIGFWYYIFGEGKMERWVRQLPITSRSSHGRTTRGSGLTIEIFCPGDDDPDGALVEDFARMVLVALEPILPTERADYYVP